MNTPQQSWQRSDGLQVRISLYCHMSADYKVMWLSLSLAWLHRPGSSDPSDFGKSRSPVCIYCWQNLCSQQYVKILLGTLKHIRFFYLSAFSFCAQNTWNVLKTLQLSVQLFFLLDIVPMKCLKSVYFWILASLQMRETSMIFKVWIELNTFQLWI